MIEDLDLKIEVKFSGWRPTPEGGYVAVLATTPHFKVVFASGRVETFPLMVTINLPYVEVISSIDLKGKMTKLLQQGMMKLQAALFLTVRLGASGFILRYRNGRPRGRPVSAFGVEEPRSGIWMAESDNM
jgi:hypothetical protein